jgi:hypothetical protein
VVAFFVFPAISTETGIVSADFMAHALMLLWLKKESAALYHRCIMDSITNRCYGLCGRIFPPFERQSARCYQEKGDLAENGYTYNVTLGCIPEDQ